MAQLKKEELQSAADQYAALHAEGKTQEEITAALAADEKGYTEKQIATIYGLITEPKGGDKTKEGKAKQYVIAKPFNDKDNFTINYQVGDDAPDHFTPERIKTLLELELIKEK